MGAMNVKVRGQFGEFIIFFLLVLGSGDGDLDHHAGDLACTASVFAS